MPVNCFGEIYPSRCPMGLPSSSKNQLSGSARTLNICEVFGSRSALTFIGMNFSLRYAITVASLKVLFSIILQAPHQFDQMALLSILQFQTHLVLKF